MQAVDAPAMQPMPLPKGHIMLTAVYSHFFPAVLAAVHVSIALLQMNPDANHVASNLEKAETYCREAAHMGADIALMPEMWSIGYTRFDPQHPGAREAFYRDALERDSEDIRRFSDLAKELSMAIGITYLEAYKPLPRNSITLFDRHGKEIFTYAKVHTSDFKPMEASMTPGDAFYVGVLDTRSGPVQVGSMICFDREQPESARLLMLQGAELILTPNACKLDELRLDQFKVRAWENVLTVAMTNYPQPLQNGRSVAYAHNGECLVMADEKEGIYLAEVDITAVREARRKSIWGNAYRRPRRYQALTSSERNETWHRIDGNGQVYDPLIR